MEKELVELQECTNLFDVTVPDYRDIKLCRKEIVVLKELWDIVLLVQVRGLLMFSNASVSQLWKKLKQSHPSPKVQ